MARLAAEKKKPQSGENQRNTFPLELWFFTEKGGGEELSFEAAGSRSRNLIIPIPPHRPLAPAPTPPDWSQ
jgi:hypothetical protein